MIAARLLVLAALAALLGCSQPRTPRAPDDADGGELTCDEKARALVLCQTALRQRCTSQGNDCESACESQGGLPANTEKETSTRGLMEATQCRENCRQTRDACLGTVVQRCPVPCP